MLSAAAAAAAKDSRTEIVVPNTTLTTMIDHQITLRGERGALGAALGFLQVLIPTKFDVLPTMLENAALWVAL